MRAKTLNFERGKEPRKALDIGMTPRREADWLVKTLDPFIGGEAFIYSDLEDSELPAGAFYSDGKWNFTYDENENWWALTPPNWDNPQHFFDTTSELLNFFLDYQMDNYKIWLKKAKKEVKRIQDMISDQEKEEENLDK